MTEEKERPIDQPCSVRPADTAAEAPAGEASPEDAATYVERLQRLQAEFENYKKRAARDAAAGAERTADRVILDFLPLYDNLQRAFAAHADDRNVDAFVAGVEQIFAQFDQILKKHGVRPISAVGDAFDPAMHEALLCVESDRPKNTIVEQFSPGYTRKERILRASKVSVSRGAGEQTEVDET